jgi:hypothetical protein
LDLELKIEIDLIINKWENYEKLFQQKMLERIWKLIYKLGTVEGWPEIKYKYYIISGIQLNKEVKKWEWCIDKEKLEPLMNIFLITNEI